MNAVVQDLARLTTAGDAPALDRAEAIKRARAALAPSLKGRQAPAYPVFAVVCASLAGRYPSAAAYDQSRLHVQNV